MVTFSVAFVFTMLVLVELTRRRPKRQLDLQASVTPHAHPHPYVSLLIGCVVQYLVLQLPFFVDGVLSILRWSCISQIGLLSELVTGPIGNITTHVYFSSNFLLYCGMSGAFRCKAAELCRQFGGCRRKSANLTHISQVGDKKEQNQAIS